jgi:hypothetical protein
MDKKNNPLLHEKVIKFWKCSIKIQISINKFKGGLFRPIPLLQDKKIIKIRHEQFVVISTKIKASIAKAADGHERFSSDQELLLEVKIRSKSVSKIIYLIFTYSYYCYK